MGRTYTSRKTEAVDVDGIVTELSRPLKENKRAKVMEIHKTSALSLDTIEAKLSWAGADIELFIHALDECISELVDLL
jgi:hypothetical protein